MARIQGVPRKPRTLYLDLADYRSLAASESFLTTPQLVELLLDGVTAGTVTVDPATVPAGTGQANVGMTQAAHDEAKRLAQELGMPNVAALIRGLLRAYLTGDVTVSLYATDRRKSPRSTPTLTVSPPAVDRPE